MIAESAGFGSWPWTIAKSLRQSAKGDITDGDCAHGEVASRSASMRFTVSVVVAMAAAKPRDGSV